MTRPQSSWCQGGFGSSRMSQQIAVIASLPRGGAHSVASHHRAVIGMCFTEIRLGKQL